MVENQGTKQRGQRTLGDCWQWETNGQCVKGDNCSFRHDTNKRGKVTPSNPSPNSFMQQSERKSSRTRSPRGKSPSGRMSRWPCKDYLRGTCNNSFCEKWHFYKTKSGCRCGKSAHSHIVRLMNNRQKGLRRMMTKVQWLYWRKVIGKEEDQLLTNVTIDRGNLVRGVIKNWHKIRLYWPILLRCDIVKDDSGAYAVFNEQGSSASQMTAAKVMDVNARRRISTRPKSKWKMHHRYWNFQSQNVQILGYAYRNTNGPNHAWSSMEDPLVPLLYGHPLTGLLWEKQFEKILLKHGWEKIPHWECLFVHREKGLFLSVYVDDIKFAGKKQNLDPMWKVLNKEVDLGEPTSFLDHVYLGCTQRQCEVSKDIVDNYRTMFESRISAVGTEKLPYSENLRISSWSYDMAGHAKKCVERYCELANKTTQQLYKVSTPCIDDHHFKEEETKMCWRIVTCMLSNCSTNGPNLR